MTARERLPELARPAVTGIKARDDQRDVQPFEDGLLALARVHHPTVKWWHGYRRARERYGSYCYVCDDFIVTWDRFAGIPVAAVDAINFHKLDHHAGRVLADVAPNRRGK